MSIRPIFLGSRVARRIFWLFVLSTLLPLALSDWLATSAVSELARDLQRRSQVQSTRQTALQVFDRLAAAKAMLVTLPTFAEPSTDSELPAHGCTRKELLRHADMAMYAAKATGRSRYALFDESLEVEAQRRLRLPNELRRALERGELAAYYQPRVCARTGRVTSAEALVRWHHPERGLLMPSAFIALAEESHLIEEIGLFMLNDACSRMGVWRDQDPDFRRVSVNVSARQLVSGHLPGLVEAALTRYSLEPQALELEITESLLVDASHGARAQLAAVRNLGVSIALDDFGTGYSSLATLRDLPIDVMKIDRAFVKDLDTDRGAAAITRTIATLAHELGLHLVAEGVETTAQAKRLAPMNCDEFQGFLYSKPLTPEAFAGFRAERARALRNNPGMPERRWV